ncbi:adenylate/guanylate cyclase domain-containing protein [Microvirga sesbaniae]|uniref:adenylate/guanylate cyclase domain-containing protein n=1 Tax=Microvirga sesbaniae TaxID=681392 RepID=UPI0021CA0776|nr:adenylate/guanylate cyclase domain-containing protein [Microvirga sp. HBU67692]
MTARRLAAILAADVVGFSTHMGQDEEGTLARIKSLRRGVVEAMVANHRGRVVKTTGDGFLVEFSSPVEAVRCAVEIQEALPAKASQESSHALQLRIGINIGDIIIEEDGDIYGDGVNVAARLEQMADAGGIWISAKVYEEVRDKLPYSFEDLGEQTFKNIARAVRIYSLAVSPERSKTAKSTKPILSLPDKPSIAVLPFTNMSGDPEQEFFADGMTEDIITGLSRLKWLFVIARNSTFTYKGRAVDVRQVARDLGVRYVLEGSVRASGKRIRITGQLIDAETGKHIWAEKYDRHLEDVFAVQDEITENVVATIEPHLYAEEGLRSLQQPPESVATWGLVVRAITLIHRVERKANEEAQALLDLAIRREPSYARAYAILAWAKWWQVFSQWFSNRNGGAEGLYRETEELAERALALDPDEPWARMTFGLTLSGAGHHDRALDQLRTALETHPNWAMGRTMYGVALLRAGYFDEAIAQTGHALRMSPVDPFAGIYTVFHGLALLAAGRFPEALVFLRRSIKGLPDLVSHYNPLISCCGHLGLVEEAQMYLTKRNSLTGRPYRVSVVRQSMSRFAHGDVFVEGLVKAGVPE